MPYYIIAVLIIGIDQFTKWLVVSKMEYGESIPVIDGFFQITSHRNTGAAWGILAGQMWFLHHYHGGYHRHCLLHSKTCQRTNPARNRSRIDAWRCCRQFYRPRVQARSCRFYTRDDRQLSLSDFQHCRFIFMRRCPALIYTNAVRRKEEEGAVTWSIMI